MKSEDLEKRDLMQVCRIDLEQLSHEELVEYTLYLKGRLETSDIIAHIHQEKEANLRKFLSALSTLFNFYEQSNK